MRISWVSDTGLYDESDDFTIEAKSITVTEPTSSTIWTKGTSANITWTSTGTISDVKIELYRGGTLRTAIATSTANTGSYTWTVDPSLPNAKNYHIKIISINVPEIYDESDNFEITN